MREQKNFSGTIDTGVKEIKEHFNLRKKILCNPGLWIELIILLLIPYPNSHKYMPLSFTMQTINFVDPGGSLFPPGSLKLETEYLPSDVMFSLMLFRFYFVV